MTIPEAAIDQVRLSSNLGDFISLTFYLEKSVRERIVDRL